MQQTTTKIRREVHYCSKCETEPEMRTVYGVERFNPEQDAFWFECPECGHTTDAGDYEPEQSEE